MAEHTKGPWTVNGTVIQDTTGYPIAQVWPNTHLSSKESICLMQANARLIAAAPDLLEACKNALNTIAIISLSRLDDNVAANKELLEVMASSFDAAIAKAE